MKLLSQDIAIRERQLIKAIATNEVSATDTEPFIYGSYLEVWFRCLKLSKQYTHNCRTGLFGSHGAAETFKWFGCVEDCTIQEWWHANGCREFGESLTSLRVRLVVSHKHTESFGISVDAYQETPNQLAGQEFCFWLQQIRKLNEHSGLLSKAPLAWPIYKSRISIDAIKLYLDVLDVYELIIRNSPDTKLWRIGEQMRLNPKAMTKANDTIREQIDKHILMGHTVSQIVKKGHGLVKNACEGVFPKFEI